MTLFACLAWYEESPSWLASLTASLARCGVGHLIAVDGAYGLFPDAKGASGTEQAAALTETATVLGMGVTIHRPAWPWMDNEIEKRNTLWALAHTLGRPGDWFLVIDADEILTAAPGDLAARLDASEYDAVDVVHFERIDWHSKPDEQVAVAMEMPDRVQQLVRRLYRFQPTGIHVIDNHTTYRTGDGRGLWGDGMDVPADQFTDVWMEHRGAHRTASRRRDRQSYYDLRDEVGAEVPA